MRRILSGISGGDTSAVLLKTDDPPRNYEFSSRRRWKRPEKVLAISGSPRGAVPTPFWRPCWTRTNGRCVLQYDMEELVGKVQEADIVLYAFPVYIDGVPGSVEHVLDRQTDRRRRSTRT